MISKLSSTKKSFTEAAPELVKEWHPTKNMGLKPADFTFGSSRKIWWQCSTADEHVWKASIKSRVTRRNGCPFCSGRRPASDKNLAIEFPNVAKEWHPTKNGEQKPSDFTSGSSKKVWWLCPVSENHVWHAVIASRTKLKAGCPFCSGRRPASDKNLAVDLPNIAKDWHPTKNGEQKPSDFTSGSSKKVWWLCENGHSYLKQISTRTGPRLGGCPECAGKKAGKDNNLLVKFPHIAAEWHPSKNKEKSPKDFTHGSKKKVWWLCSKGHEYRANINNRTGNKAGCPKCSNQSSEPEIRVLAEMEWLFDEAVSRKRIDRVELDVFIPAVNLGIEYDGSHFHFEKEKRDTEKNEFFRLKNIEVIRLRHSPLTKISSNDLIVSQEPLLKKDIDALINKIIEIKCLPINAKIEAYLLRKDFANQEAFRTYLSYFPSPLPEHSLLSLYPEISKIWDYDRNFPLRPENFTAGSGRKVWWLCENGHHTETTIHSRVSGRKCALCPTESGGYAKANEEYNLQVNRPDIAAEWHLQKNKGLKPNHFTPHSNFKVWWLCNKGHEYQSTIGHRTASKPAGCPYCSGNRVAKDTSLEFLRPDIAKEWHPTKNGESRPIDFSVGSSRKVWWICGEGHEYSAVICARAQKKRKGTGCPVCSGRSISKKNRLSDVNPSVAKEWHPNKNKNLTPNDVSFGSSKKVRWLCDKGHEYQSTIGNRTASKPAGCPYCSGRRVAADTNLAYLRPDIAKEWHSSKNGTLTPADVTLKSSRKVWWKCPKGHEYQAAISNRTNGTGCLRCWRDKSMETGIEP